MPNQKALRIPVKQGDWEVADVAIPTPGPKDVLVKVISAALNPVDWKMQAWGLMLTDSAYPFISGSEVAGIVEQVGSEVSDRVKGDKILFQGAPRINQRTAAFQQYAIISAEITAKIPDNISFDQAASVPAGLATASIALWNHHPEAKTVNFPAPWEEGGLTRFAGKPAFILGGSSCVGQYVIQLARLQKFSPIITTASLKNESLLKSLGATHVLDRSLSSFAILNALQHITENRPIEYVYDAVAHADTQALAYQALAPGGALLLVLPDEIPAELKKEGDGKKVVFLFGNPHPPENRQIGVEMHSRLTEWLKDGVIVPNRVQVLPNGLAGIPDGLERIKQNKVSATKLIAHPQETS
ncbi:GroES-like protein [Daedaleopsis nitida]|nr:GroES-like protein [Daedaleopsis nitida]